MEEFLAEDYLLSAVDVLVRIVEAGGAVIIFAGALTAFFKFIVAAIRSRRSDDFVTVRLSLGRFLALGLEFQLAGDILRTAVAPTFSQIGQLAAIAAIRTVLNYFLRREIREEREELEARPMLSDDVKSKGGAASHSAESG
ncbi:MAG: DUF1622 domain-containing protein [Actinobacteria bacterium]|nr:DUF1622 domain-containing protein [Actinomycetota bacterium]